MHEYTSKTSEKWNFKVSEGWAFGLGLNPLIPLSGYLNPVSTTDFVFLFLLLAPKDPERQQSWLKVRELIPAIHLGDLNCLPLVT